MMWMLMLVGVAQAQGVAQLVDGSPEFEEGCFNNSACQDAFYEFLSTSMAEQGFTMQHNALASSSLVQSESGLFAGAMLTTFPFAKPRSNLAGKEENTSFSPVLPRLLVGYAVDRDGGIPSGFAASAFFLPPVPIQGASALIAGIDASGHVDVSDSFRVGAEVDFTYTRARAPIVASKEQFENRDDFGNPDNLNVDTYNEVCAPQPNGCVDTFTVASPSLRAGVAWDLATAFTLTGKLGLTYVNERLWVEYDDTTWAVTGLQPNLHVGAAVRPTSKLLLTAGTGLTPRPASYGDLAGPLFFKVEGAAAWRF